MLSDLDPNDFRILSRKLVKRYELDKERTAEIAYSDEILLATLTPDTKKIEIQMGLEKVDEKAVYVHPVKGGYQLRETELVRALIKNAKGQVSDNEVREKIAELTKQAFKGGEEVLIKEYDGIDDNKEIKYVVFLESVKDDLEPVKEFLKGYTYQNTLVHIRMYFL